MLFGNSRQYLGQSWEKMNFKMMHVMYIMSNATELILPNGTITKELCNWIKLISVAQCLMWVMSLLKVWLHTNQGCNHQSFWFGSSSDILWGPIDCTWLTMHESSSLRDSTLGTRAAEHKGCNWARKLTDGCSLKWCVWPHLQWRSSSGICHRNKSQHSTTCSTSVTA